MYLLVGFSSRGVKQWLAGLEADDRYSSDRARLTPYQT